MRLIRTHRPGTATELAGLIARHAREICPCGLVSKGSVHDFGQRLLEAQFRYWGEARFSLEECVQWEYDLFVIQSMKGSRMEVEAARTLTAALGPPFLVQHTDSCTDCELRVDLEVLRSTSRIAGVQVKPSSFQFVRPSVVEEQRRRQRSFGAPILEARRGRAPLAVSELVRELRCLA